MEAAHPLVCFPSQSAFAIALMPRQAGLGIIFFFAPTACPRGHPRYNVLRRHMSGICFVPQREVGGDGFSASVSRMDGV